MLTAAAAAAQHWHARWAGGPSAVQELEAAEQSSYGVRVAPVESPRWFGSDVSTLVHSASTRNVATCIVFASRSCRVNVCTRPHLNGPVSSVHRSDIVLHSVHHSMLYTDPRSRPLVSCDLHQEQTAERSTRKAIRQVEQNTGILPLPLSRLASSSTRQSPVHTCDSRHDMRRTSTSSSAPHQADLPP